MTCRTYVKLIIDVDGIDTIIDTQMINTSHNLLLHLADLDYGRKLDLGTLKKERVNIFSSHRGYLHQEVLVQGCNGGGASEIR